jgi:hypothetical protein
LPGIAAPDSGLTRMIVPSRPAGSPLASCHNCRRARYSSDGRERSTRTTATHPADHPTQAGRHGTSSNPRRRPGLTTRQKMFEFSGRGVHPRRSSRKRGDHHGEREYIVCYGKRRTYRELSVPEPESEDALWSESRRAQGGIYRRTRSHLPAPPPRPYRSWKLASSIGARKLRTSAPSGTARRPPTKR